jgi:hypothetical protein
MARIWTRRPLYAAGALALCGALVTVAAARDTSDQRSPAALFSQVLLSTDGHTLTTPVRWSPCQAVEPQLTAEETANTVAAELSTGTADLTHQCADSDHQITVTLHAALGTRQLTDATTAADITPFPATRLAAVGYLPAGFSATTDVPSDSASSGASWEAQPFDRTATAGPAWTRYYATPGAQPTLSITQVLAASAPAARCNAPAGTSCPSPSYPTTASSAPASTGPGACASTPVLVNRHPATLLCDTASERAITWSDGNSTFTVISHDPRRSALSTGELLLIARNMR